MKRGCSNGFLIFFFVIVLLCYSTSARLLQPKPGIEKKVKVSVSSNEVRPTERKREDVSGLMGSDEEENCGGEDDEDCLRRRIAAEAHLDYIYSQSLHNKP